VQGDGKILLGGDNGLTRLTSSGAVDSGLNGPASTSYQGHTGTVNAIAVQDDGKIWVGGDFTGGIKCLNPDGTLDQLHPPALDGDVKTLVIQRNTTVQYGKILIGRAFGLKRLNNPSQSSSDRSGTIVSGGSSNAVWIILIAAAGLAVFSGGVTIARRCKPAAR
jgi:hypothetical protein